MRDDYLRAAAALRTMSQAIHACSPGDKHRLTAYMVKLGRVVRDNPIVSAAVAELGRRECSDEDMLTRRAEAVSEKGTAWFKRLAEALHHDGKLSESSLALLRQHYSLDARAAVPKDLRAVLQEAWRRTLSPLSCSDIAVFQRNVAGRLRDLLQPHIQKDLEVTDILTLLDDFQVIANEAAEVLGLEEVMRKLSVSRVVSRIQMHATAWESLLSNAEPLPPTASGPRSVWLDDIQRDVPIVVEFIAAQLEEGVARRHAIHRLRVLFEQFDYERLRSALAAAEHAKRSREAVLQEDMDRFLFHDGYFPVTHAEASRGFFDTLLLERAEASGVPPLLIELKQVVALANPSEASRKAVSEAVAAARGEVERYRGHIATRPQWAGLLPVIVVVHTCVEDLSDLEAADVVLIDLSTASPSRKKRQRV